MINSKKMVVTPGLDLYFFKDFNNDSIILKEVYNQNDSIIIKIIKKISVKFKFVNLYRFLISNWKKDLKECNIIIIFDASFSVALIRAIKRIAPNIRIILYIWNPILGNIKRIDEINEVKEYMTIYSFDKNDCEKYGFIFSPMVYDFANREEVKEEEYQYDVTFVGAVKNRGKILDDFYKKLLKDNYKAYYYVFDNSNLENNYSFKIYDKYLDYNKYKEKMLASKAILDMTQEGQIGLTIRTMEAMNYKKKLITTNKDIMNYDFYNPANIFIIDYDSYERLYDFLSSSFEEIPEDIIKEYNFIDWVNNF